MASVLCRHRTRELWRCGRNLHSRGAAHTEENKEYQLQEEAEGEEEDKNGEKNENVKGKKKRKRSRWPCEKRR